MVKELRQYWIDRLKLAISNKISGENKRHKTAMQQLLLILKVKNLLPKHIMAVELFGMHGLWHTMDYIEKVESLDIFEINPTYHKLSKRLLKKYSVRFFLQDSIAFIATTNLRYNFVVADIPFGGNFYTSNGLPFFLLNLIKLVDPDGGVLIFNCHARYFQHFENLKLQIASVVDSHSIKEIFCMPRNESIGYIILALTKIDQ